MVSIVVETKSLETADNEIKVYSIKADSSASSRNRNSWYFREDESAKNIGPVNTRACVIFDSMETLLFYNPLLLKGYKNRNRTVALTKDSGREKTPE